MEQRTSEPLLRRFAALITRRNRKPAHLGDRVPAQPEHARRLPPAVPLNQHIPANRPINLHLKHLQPSSPHPEKDSFSSGRLLRRHAQRPYAAAPWPTISPPRTPATPQCTKYPRQLRTVLTCTPGPAAIAPACRPSSVSRPARARSASPRCSDFDRSRKAARSAPSAVSFDVPGMLASTALIPGKQSIPSPIRRRSA